MVEVDWENLLICMADAVAFGVIDSFDEKIKRDFEALRLVDKTDVEKFIEKRLDNNYSREEVAKELGINTSTIRNYELGNKVSGKMERKIKAWNPAKLNFELFVLKHELKYVEVANIVGVSPVTVSRWVNDKKDVPVYAKKRLLEWVEM